MAGVAFTYDETARRESLLDVITNISPTDTQLLSGLKKSTASNTLHEWPVDTLNAAAANAQVEGAASGTAGQTNPTRANNITQIIRTTYEVSGTERAVNHAGFNDRKAYEMRKAMKEHANDTEFALMRASKASGSGSGARQMNGIKNSITTHATSHSGVSLSETMLNDYFGNVWDSGGDVDEIYVGKVLKRRISGFTAGATKNVDIEDKRLVNTVDVYESDFGLVKIFKHRHVTVSGDTHNDIVGIEADKWAVAYLREPKNVELAKTGDSDKANIISEVTLEARAQAANFLTTKLL